ncbi:MAG: EamA family transporter, partial [Clostridiales bacterium]
AMSFLQLAAVLLICGGIVALAIYEKRQDDSARVVLKQDTDSKYRSSFLALTLPILYCFIDGLGTFADAFVLDEKAYFSEAEANLSYEYIFFICAVFAYIYLTKVRKQSYLPQREKLRGLAAICETIGQFFYVFAIADNAIVAAPMISSYSIFSVLFSRIFLKEKLSRRQYLIIIVVLIGIAMLGLAEELL